MFINQIDVVNAAASGGVDRADLARVISGWELGGVYYTWNLGCNIYLCLAGLVTTKPSQVRAVRILFNFCQ
jgi:hypothetical protein